MLKNYFTNLLDAVLARPPSIERLRQQVTDDYLRTLKTRVWVLNPKPEDFYIEDIAHSLSLKCRFNGYSKFFYSVAQHCVHVAEQAKNLSHYYNTNYWQYNALMHDRTESYITDLITPVKNVMREYKIVEDNMDKVSAVKFNLVYPEPKEIKFIDKKMLITEASQLFAHDDCWWQHEKYDYLGGPYDLEIEPWSPEIAKQKFLDKYYQLSKF